MILCNFYVGLETVVKNAKAVVKKYSKVNGFKTC